ncbi:MAG: GFA family protein [Gammaproteobacteria bacterium]|nr:GFA family protein [Gammaproteobacteria bacterium]
MSDIQAIEGGCLCGSIRYRASSMPLRGVICHCAMCRRHSGAPALSFVHFAREEFRWLGDEPARYRSSEFAERGFCRNCGSTVSMHEEVLADRVQIAVGSLDEPNRITIDDHVWTSEQIDWFDIADDLPRFSRSSDAVASKA